MALGHLPGIDVVVESDDLEARPDDDVETAVKLDIAREFAQRPADPGNKRIVFRFFSAPTELVGEAHVEGLQVVHPGGAIELIETRLILRSIGYQGSPIDGVPFDSSLGVVPNDGGRVLGDGGQPVSGVYVTGWIKRGPRGVIGTNRTCAQQTVARLWADFDAGELARDVEDRTALLGVLAERGADRIDWEGWRSIDVAELKRGAELSRPRAKFVDIADMRATAKG